VSGLPGGILIARLIKIARGNFQNAKK
jgi:hypothetical protein